MNKILGVLLLCLGAQPVFAGYGDGVVDRYYVDNNGWVYFGLTTALPGTCNYFIEQFRFDGSTAGGKNILATLMTAKLSTARITLWFNDSPVPGSNENTGCNGGTLAQVTAAGVR